MHVGLVARVPDKAVVGGIKNVMQRDSQLNDAQVARQVATGARYVFYKEMSDFTSERWQGLNRQALQVAWRRDSIEELVLHGGILSLLPAN